MKYELLYLCVDTGTFDRIVRSDDIQQLVRLAEKHVRDVAQTVYDCAILIADSDGNIVRTLYDSENRKFA